MDFRDCAKWRIPDVQCASGMTPVGAKSVALLGSKSRPCAVPAVSDAWRLQATVRLLLRSRDENLGARLHVILATYDIGDNDRVGAHNQFLLAILVFDGQRRPIDPGNRLFEVPVGLFVLGLETPVEGALAGAAHRFWEDMHLDGFLGAVGLHHSRRTNEHPGFYVGHGG